MELEGLIGATNNTTCLTNTLGDFNDEFEYSDLNWTFSGDFLMRRSEKSKVEITLKCVFYVIAICLALFGNLAIITVVLRTRSLRTKFNIYIVNLAIADLFIPSCSMWLHLGSNIYGQWVFGQVMCRIHTFIQVSFVCASVFTLFVLTLDRYLATIHSHYAWITQTFQIAIITLIWIISLAVGAPWIIYTVYRELDWLGGNEIICQANFPSVRSRQMYYLAYFVLCYGIPMLFMFLFAISMLIKTNQRASAISASDYPYHEMQKKAVNLLLTVLVAFCLCWTPQQSLLLWDVFRDRHKRPRGIDELQYITLYMAYCSSVVNPILYFIFNKYFRHAFYYLCKTKCRGHNRQTAISPGIELHATTSDTEQRNAVPFLSERNELSPAILTTDDTQAYSI